MDTTDLFRRAAFGRAAADMRLVTVADGPGAGGRLLELRTPEGLAADIALDRGGDVLRLAWRGREIGWHGPTGAPMPWHDLDAEAGLGFLRGFDGFLVTCGLDHHGPPTTTPADAFAYPLRSQNHHPLHGRIAATKAELVAKEIDWPAGRIRVALRARQATVFGEVLEMDREIAVPLDRPALCIRDRVTNRGYEPARHGLLYHCNVGHPLLGEGARLTGMDGAQSAVLAEGATPTD